MRPRRWNTLYFVVRTQLSRCKFVFLKALEQHCYWSTFMKDLSRGSRLFARKFEHLRPAQLVVRFRWMFVRGFPVMSPGYSARPLWKCKMSEICSKMEVCMMAAASIAARAAEVEWLWPAPPAMTLRSTLLWQNVRNFHQSRNAILRPGTIYRQSGMQNQLTERP